MVWRRERQRENENYFEVINSPKCPQRRCENKLAYYIHSSYAIYNKKIRTEYLRLCKMKVVGTSIKRREGVEEGLEEWTNKEREQGDGAEWRGGTRV